jgi:Fe-S cluster assembly protein SufD
MPTTLEPVSAPVPAPARPLGETLREALACRPGAGSEPAGLREFREAGLREFLRTGYPTLQDEDWRFTNLAPLQQVPFRPAARPDFGPEVTERLARLPFLAGDGPVLVFVDGHFAPRLSRGVLPAARDGGLVCTDLASALAQNPDLLTAGPDRLAAAADNPFTALNQAFFTNGAYLHVPPGHGMTLPLRLVHLTSGRADACVSFVRHRLHVGAGARVTVIELSAGLDGAAHVANHLTELLVGEGAVVEHLKFQDQPAETCEISGLYTRTARGVKLHAHSFALGARLSRHHIRLSLRGEDAEAVLNGLYLVNGERLADHHMIVEHASPRCASHEYFNGILADRARGVFHGRILVRPGAQKTDAKQTNKNLLLSDEAVADTKPQLEIYADDVKCTHGATVGQLHPEHIFYLRARGIPRERARQMLIHAFAGEIIDRVQCAAAREELDRLIWDRLETEERLGLGTLD